MRHAALAIAGLALLAACAPPPEPPQPLPPDAGTCDAPEWSALLLGQTAQAARQLLASRDAADPFAVRIVFPNQPVTLDYRADRLNVEIGADGRVIRVSCG